MWDCIGKVDVSTRAKKSLADFKKMIQIFNNKAETSDAYELAEYIGRQSGLIKLLKQDTTTEGMGRLENVIGLLDGIKEFVENDEVSEITQQVDKSLVSYLQNIALLTDADDKKKDGDFVTLMSVHAAKGLEFKSVFVVGLEEQLFPSFMSMESADQIDEERRLFYVAITRAEEALTLSFAKGRYKFGKMRYNAPSRFLGEVGIGHLQSMSGTIPGHSQEQQAPTRSKVIGNFKKNRNKRNSANQLKINPADFKPSPSNTIKEGMTVLHMKFGEGKVLKVEGPIGDKRATIHFKEVDYSPQKLIVLRFAKLQILEKA